ncbi:MAG: HD-GYP domain-containing protein [Myxococcales bacterium]
MNDLLAEIRAYDPYTAQHGDRVARYAVAIGRGLGLPPEQVEAIRWAALLHDIGKLWVPTEILLKPGSLDADETSIMRRHAGFGAELLQRRGLAACAFLVGQHHERIDGQGYPLGCAGRDIHPHARIVSVADVYDAMTTDRSYRRSLGHPQAEAELRRVAGTQLDADVVAAFLDLRARQLARRHRVAEERPG